jgi:nucleoside-diphosphate-sugar epimerase
MKLRRAFSSGASMGPTTLRRARAKDAEDRIVGPEERILVTGAAGFVGSRVVECLIRYGYKNICCLVRPTSKTEGLEVMAQALGQGGHLEIVKGNLLSRDDCARVSRRAVVIYHLAAGRGEKSYPDAFMNSVVSTRNLLEAAYDEGVLRRFVNVSSFAVYSNQAKPKGRLLDETCPVEVKPSLRGDAYGFAKVKQDEIVMEYGRRLGIPHVIVRPGVVYGPGNETISPRVGIGTFGVFLHLGGSNPVPLTFVDNCAEAVVLAGLKAGVDGEVFNVIDDDLPSSRRYLTLYKKNAQRFFSVSIPRPISYLLCFLWGKYSVWSEGQLPPTYGLRTWHAYWKRTRYSNEKLKAQLGWRPRVTTANGLEMFFESCRRRSRHA